MDIVIKIQLGLLTLMECRRDYHIVTGKQTLVSNKGGDTTDYTNFKADGRDLFTVTQDVKHVSMTIDVPFSRDVGSSSVIRLPGSVSTFTTQYTPTSHAIEPMDFSSPFFPMGMVLGNAIKGMGSIFGTSVVKGGTEALSSLNPTHYITKSESVMKKFVSAVKADGAINQSILYVENNGSKFIVDGHHRFFAAQKLGIKNVPVQQVQLPFN